MFPPRYWPARFFAKRYYPVSSGTVPSIWTPTTPASSTWAAKSKATSIWTPKTPSSTTWTKV